MRDRSSRHSDFIRMAAPYLVPTLAVAIAGCWQRFGTIQPGRPPGSCVSLEGTGRLCGRQVRTTAQNAKRDLTCFAFWETIKGAVACPERGRGPHAPHFPEEAGPVLGRAPG